MVYASKERIKLDKITYEDLANSKWHGKICIRSGQHVYNVALIASLIAAHGEAWTETWLKGVKADHRSHADLQTEDGLGRPGGMQTMNAPTRNARTGAGPIERSGTTWC